MNNTHTTIITMCMNHNISIINRISNISDIMNIENMIDNINIICNTNNSMFIIDGYIMNNIDDYIRIDRNICDRCFNLMSRRHLRHEDYNSRYTPHKKYLCRTF